MRNHLVVLFLMSILVILLVLSPVKSNTERAIRPGIIKISPIRNEAVVPDSVTALKATGNTIMPEKQAIHGNITMTIAMDGEVMCL